MGITKKILLIIALLLVAGLIGFAIYYTFFKTTITPIIGPDITTTTLGTLPSAGARPTSVTTDTEDIYGVTLPTAGIITEVLPSYYEPKLVNEITSDYATYPSLNTNGAFRYHNALDGKFYQVTTDGKVKEIADKVFYGVSDVTWANNKDKAVIEYPDKSKIIYDFEKNKQVSLPKHWEEFSFSPDGDEVAAKSMALAPENRWLVTIKDDGSKVEAIEPMGNNANEVTIDWSPNRQVVAFSTTGQSMGADREEVLLVGLNGENFKSLIVEGNGFESTWSPTGKKLIYSVYSQRSEYKPELWVVDSYGESIGSNRKLLNLNTWPEKCTFSGDTVIYCAIPRDLPTGAGLSKAAAKSTFDNLYKIDLSTGLKTRVALDNDYYHLENISYDSNNNKLFFTDQNKTGVFEVAL